MPCSSVRKPSFFFAVVFAVYWALPWHRARDLAAAGASFYFYASWNRWLALHHRRLHHARLLPGPRHRTLAGDRAARRLPARRQPRRPTSACSGYFKYANFFLDSLDEALRAAGLDGVASRC